MPLPTYLLELLNNHTKFICELSAIFQCFEQTVLILKMICLQVISTKTFNSKHFGYSYAYFPGQLTERPAVEILNVLLCPIFYEPISLHGDAL